MHVCDTLVGIHGGVNLRTRKNVGTTDCGKIHYYSIENQTIGTAISGCSFPPAGEITRVLFDIVLKEVIDREFPIKFPGICFSRFKNEVFISTREEDQVLFDELAGYALLKELGLAGRILSIGPGEKPIMCHNKILHIDPDSHQVIVYDIENIEYL